MPGFAFLSKCASAAFRSLSGRARVSVPSIANKNGDNQARETVASRVIELARRGERSSDRLRDRVLREANGESESSEVGQQ
jgi:hypothetical protein